MAVISIPKILRDKLTDDGADALVELLDKAGTRSEESMLERAEDRFEKRLMEVKTELIKWMFIFWIGQFASIVGVLTAILFHPLLQLRQPGLQIGDSAVQFPLRGIIHNVFPNAVQTARFVVYRWEQPDALGRSIAHTNIRRLCGNSGLEI